MAPNGNETNNTATARRYLAALERGESADTIAEFFHADVIAEELPNRLSPGGVRRDLPALLHGVEQGLKVIASQRFEVLGALAEGERVALEVAWSGTLTCSYGEKLPEGTMLRARLAIFLAFRAGRIISQRNYDCYEAW
jgi:ketosteroid isomerase-like protein